MKTPNLFRAVYSHSLTEILFGFDVLVENINHTNTNCSSFFPNPTIFGSGAACHWRTNKLLVARLGTSPTVTVGYVANFVANLTNTNSVALSYASQSTSPIISIDGVTELSACALSLELNGKILGGLGNLDAKSISWRIDSDTDSLSNLININNILSSTNSLSLHLNANLFTLGSRYIITLNVTNNAGLSTATTHSFTRQAISRVNVNILGPSSLFVYPEDNIIVWAEAFLDSNPNCTFGALSGSIFKFAWSKLTGPVIPLDLNTSITNVLNLVPGSLKAGYTYVIEVSVSLDDDLSTLGRDQIVIEVGYPPLTVGQISTVLVNRLTTVSLSAFDYSGRFENTSRLEFQWECYEEILPNVACPVESFLVGPKIEFEASNLSPGTWFFELFVTDPNNNRKSRAIVLVEVSWSDVPFGTIALINEDGFYTQFNKLKHSPTSPIALLTDAYPLKGTTVSYHWSETLTNISLENLSFTSNNQRILYLNSNTLQESRHYTFKSVYRLTAGDPGVFYYSFQTNDIPRLGSCILSGNTSSAVEMQTVFTIRCSGFIDDSLDLPLRYHFWWQSAYDQNQYRIPLVTGPVINNAINFTLPWSASALGVTIIDTGETFTTVTFDGITVATNRSASITNATQEIEYISNTVNTVMSNAINRGMILEIQQALFFSYNLLSRYSELYTNEHLTQLRVIWSGLDNLRDKYFVVLNSRYFLELRGLIALESVKPTFFITLPLQVRSAESLRNLLLSDIPPYDISTSNIYSEVYSYLMRAQLMNNYFDRATTEQQFQHTLNLGKRFSTSVVQIIERIREAQAALVLNSQERLVSSSGLSVFVRRDTISKELFTTNFVLGFNVTTPYGSYSVNYTNIMKNYLQIALNDDSQEVITSAYVSAGNFFQWANGSVLATPIFDISFLHPSTLKPLKLSNLLSPINVNFTLFKNITLSRSQVFQCVAWNGTSWSSNGCVNPPPLYENDTVALCSCNHTTNFAVRVLPLVPFGVILSPLATAGTRPSNSFPVWLIPLAIAVLFFILVMLLLIAFRSKKRDHKLVKGEAFSYTLVKQPVLKAKTRKVRVNPLEDSESEHLDVPTKQSDSGVPPKSYYVVYEPASSEEVSISESYEQPPKYRTFPRNRATQHNYTKVTTTKNVNRRPKVGRSSESSINKSFTESSSEVNRSKPSNNKENLRSIRGGTISSEVSQQEFESEEENIYTFEEEEEEDSGEYEWVTDESNN